MLIDTAFTRSCIFQQLKRDVVNFIRCYNQRKIAHYHFQLFAPFAWYPVFRILGFRPERYSSQRQNEMWKKTFISRFTHPWLSWSIKIQNKPCDIGGPDGAVTPVQMMGPVSAGDLLRAKCTALFPSPHPGWCLHLGGNEDYYQRWRIHKHQI